ncbi:hypothetical protein ACFL43_03530 [Thermodesulfobacteriota bacterium]
MRKVSAIAARRTAIGTFDGTLKTASAVDLGAKVAKSLFAESGIEGILPAVAPGKIKRELNLPLCLISNHK